MENVCFITYEEMKKDLAAVIGKVSLFLGCNISEKNIPSLVEHLSFDKMKDNKSVNKEEFVEVLYMIFSSRRNIEVFLILINNVASYLILYIFQTGFPGDL